MLWRQWTFGVRGLFEKQRPGNWYAKVNYDYNVFFIQCQMLMVVCLFVQ